MISQAYLELLRQHKKANPSWGGSASHWMGDIQKVIYRHQPATLLDYGCGRAVLRSLLPGINYFGYDPVTSPEGYTKCDVSLCLDVLEHVEHAYIEKVMEHFFKSFTKGFLIAVDTLPARSMLPDGRNCHILQQPHEWWHAMIARHCDNCTIENRGRYVIAYY